MITAKELFNKYSDLTSLTEGHYDYLVDEDNFKDALIEFAKLHVQEALKLASKNATMISNEEQDFRFQNCNCIDYKIDKESILNSYPLENIK